MKNIFYCGLLILFSYEFLCAQGLVKDKAKGIGFQTGFSYSRISKIETGGNYYWSKAIKNDNYHTFGPFINVTGMWAHKVFYIGKQVGFNYHYGWATSFRLSLSYEINFHHDNRVGCDVGFSTLGVFMYGGYYHPVGKAELPEISRLRIGIRLIFNKALIDAGPDIS